MRVAIVGGGVIGLLTAVHCVSAGHRVTLVDQGSIPFSGATSHDHQRVIRALHARDPATTRAALHAHHRWIDLQGLLSATFYEQVGAVTVIDADELWPACAMLAQAGSRTRVLTQDDLEADYAQAAFPPGARAILEPQAGVLLADRVLLACAGWLRHQPGAELQPGRRAVAVEPDGPAVLLADGGTLRADALLLATGPWSRALLAPDIAAQLRLYRQTMIHAAVPDAVASAWSVSPVIRDVGPDRGAWIIPPVAGTPLTFSSPEACRETEEMDGDVTSPAWRERMIAAAAQAIPGFRAEWLTSSRDSYYLARASTGGPMIVAAGQGALAFAACGGSSFKFAPLIARSLAQRLTGVHPVPTGLSCIDGAATGAVPAALASPR